MASEKHFKNIPPFPNDCPTAYMSTISLSKLMSNDQTATKTLFDACQELGFFLLDLNGDPLGEIMMEEIDDLFDAMKEIMALPEEVKAKHAHDPPRSFLGFKPRGAAKTETGDPDRFEWFNIGQDGLMGTAPLQSLPDIALSNRDVLTSFLRHGQAVVSRVCESLARNLQLPPSTFTELQSFTKPSGTVVRFVKAEPSLREEDLRTSMVHHTDFGTVTLLVNVLGGLQILQPGKAPTDPSGWLYARPKPGCLIVNLGDAMVQWTGGLLRSNCHRINYAPGEQRFVERHSMAILFRPERDASMKSLIGKGASEIEQADGLSAWEWEVKKAMALKAGEDVMQSKGGRSAGCLNA